MSTLADLIEENKYLREKLRLAANALEVGRKLVHIVSAPAHLNAVIAVAQEFANEYGAWSLYDGE